MRRTFLVALLAFVACASPALAFATELAFASLPAADHPDATMSTSAEREAAKRLIERWGSDPVRFSDEALGQASWSKQAEFMRAVASHDRVAVRSGHKTGKSNSFAKLAYWFVLTQGPDARVIMTSAGNRQVKSILWREIKSMHRHARVPIGGTMHDDPATGLKFADGREIVGFTTKDKEKMAGYSGAKLLFLVDEGSGVPDDIYQAIDGNRAGGAKIAAASNPTQTSGWFYDAFHEKRAFWRGVHLKSTDTPNVTEGRIVIPGLATREWCDEKAAEYGVDSSLYAVRVAGDFPGQGTNAVIGLALVTNATSDWSGTDFATAAGRLNLGVDVARYGDDESVIQPRRGQVTREPLVLSKHDTVHVAGATREFALDLRRKGERPLVKVDVIGIGAGVADILRQDPELEVIDVNVASSPTAQPESGPGYALLRDQLWFATRDWLKAGGKMPSDTRLETELVAPTYSFDPRGRLKVESKDAIRKRLNRSPDRADALALAVYEPPSTEPAPFEPVVISGRWS